MPQQIEDKSPILKDTFDTIPEENNEYTDYASTMKAESKALPNITVEVTGDMEIEEIEQLLHANDFKDMDSNLLGSKYMKGTLKETLMLMDGNLLKGTIKDEDFNDITS